MTEPADSAELWDDLKELVRNVVEEMNRLEEFRNKTGGLDYQLDETDSIIVTRRSYPSMVIIISGRPDALRIESSLRGSGAEPIESHENLAVSFAESGPSFSTPSGEVLTTEETVYYILRPFLHLTGVAASFRAKR